MHADGAGVVRELQGGDEHVALTDADGHGIARKPHLRFLAAEGGALPRRRRYQAILFARDVDAGELTEAKLDEEVVDAVDLEPVRESEEIDVARGGDRFAHIDHTVALVLPVATNAIARDLERAAAELGGLRRGDAILEARERHARLDRRAGRIRTAQRAIEHRPVRILGERQVLLARQAA